ncbi:Uncharacterised protein [Vibrio cholerae]|nr:Uncharacterised protein [Vibrio cholerae]
MCIVATRTDRNQIVFRLQHITITGNDQRCGFIGDRQNGFQTAQRAIASPIFG